MDINEDETQYVKHFFDKICNDYNTKPNSIGLVDDVSTLTKVVGRLVQDYEKYKGLNEEFTSI
jgi:ribulose kinase